MILDAGQDICTFPSPGPSFSRPLDGRPPEGLYAPPASLPAARPCCQGTLVGPTLPGHGRHCHYGACAFNLGPQLSSTGTVANSVCCHSKRGLSQPSPIMAFFACRPGFSSWKSVSLDLRHGRLLPLRGIVMATRGLLPLPSNKVGLLLCFRHFCLLTQDRAYRHSASKSEGLAPYSFVKPGHPGGYRPP